jgi:Flp pilus assembly protein TadB
MAVTDREEFQALRDDGRRVRDSVRKDNIEERLEGVIEERPGVRPFLEFRPLGVAVLVAAFLTLVSLVLFSPTFAAVVLVLAFGITWVAMARREYSKREPTSEFDPEADDTPGKGDKEVAPYSA